MNSSAQHHGTGRARDAAKSSRRVTTNVAVGGGVATATGVFSWTLLDQLGAKGLLANAQGGLAIIYAITVLAFIMLIILTAGYFVASRDSQVAPRPLWVGIGVSGFLTVVGFAVLAGEYIYNPGATVTAYMGPGSDLGSIQSNPPLKLAAYINNDSDDPLPANKGKAQRIHLNDQGELVVDIAHFYELRNFVENLRQEAKGGQSAAALLDCSSFQAGSDPAHQCKVLKGNANGNEFQQ